MSEEVNKEQTKAAKQEKSTELTDDQLDEAAGGTSTGDNKFKAPDGGSGHNKAFEDISRSLGSG